MIIEFQLNGEAVSVEAEPDMRALDLLRETLGLTGTKEGCGTGECGACAVWIDGRTRLSCLTLAGQLAGREVTTVEGLCKDAPHPVQEAMAERGGVQCGFCTPGVVMSAAELLASSPEPGRQEIRQALSGHLCRCTGYHKIVDAVEDAARKMRGEE